MKYYENETIDTKILIYPKDKKGPIKSKSMNFSKH